VDVALFVAPGGHGGDRVGGLLAEAGRGVGWASSGRSEATRAWAAAAGLTDRGEVGELRPSEREPP